MIDKKRYKGLSFMTQNTINAVNYKDLETFLKSLGEYENIVQKKAKCEFCGDLISFNNIYSVFPNKIDHEVKYCCKKIKCVISLSDLCFTRGFHDGTN